MAGTSLLMLIDDIATLLEDVAVLTKVAGTKTAGIVGDDLAVNAGQVTGVDADRELPVVWAVAKGSALNKAILVPLALVISAIVPWAITPMLMMGGAYLCFEGVEKVAHKLLHSASEDKEHHEELLEALTNEAVDMVQFEKDKIAGAIRTDFILSAEIIIIALGTVADADLFGRIVTLVVIAIIMTVVVYGLIAAIVKLDDVGLYLSEQPGARAKLGGLILAGAPWMMKGLAVVGTIAMLLVGGGIFAHGIPGLEAFLHHTLPHEGLIGSVVGLGANFGIGLIAGIVVVAVVTGFQKLRGQ